MRRTVPLLLLWVVGCGGDPTSPPVAVAVRLDGQPAGGLDLRLTDPAGRAVAGGATDATGRAVLIGPNAGPVPPGTYKVVVTDLGPDEENPMTVPAAKGRPVSRVPAACTRPATTPLALTVEAGKTEYTLDILADKR